MPGRLTRFAVAAISTIALSPTIASAQSWNGRSSRANGDSTDSCGQSGCAWFTFVNDFPFGMLGFSRAHRSTARPGSSMLFGFDDDVRSFRGNSFSSLSDCPACKSNDRPFVVPPGIEKKLANQHGAQTGDDADDGDHAAEISEREGGTPMQTPGRGEGGENGVGQDPPGSSVAGAATPAVVLTPEPGAFVLLATGMLALVPVVVRARRRQR